MGLLLPDERIWKLASSGKNYAVWENIRPPVTNNIIPSLIDEDEALYSKGPLHNVPIKLQLLNKMSGETRKRILAEYPELINAPVQNKAKINSISDLS